MDRYELYEKYGRPVSKGFVEEGTVYTSLHESKESAEAYLNVNEDHYGHPGWIEEREDGWLLYTDLRPALVEAQRKWQVSDNEN